MGSLFSSTVFRLGVVGARWEGRFADALAADDLKPKHVALMALLERDAPRTQQELAALMQVAPSFVVALADHLEELGAVRRERDSADRRRQVLQLTAKGARLLRRCEKAMAALDDELHTHLGAQADALRTALSALYEDGENPAPSRSASGTQTGRARRR